MTLAAPRIDAEFAKLIAPLSEDERAQLEANLVAANGARDAIVVWRGLLLDGHNRLEICRRHGLPFRVKDIELSDRIAARIWIRWNQLGRRNLTDDQRAMQIAGLVEDVAAQSKHSRASTAGKAGGISRPRNSSRVAVSRKLSAGQHEDKLSGARVSSGK